MVVLLQLTCQIARLGLRCVKLMQGLALAFGAEKKSKRQGNYLGSPWRFGSEAGGVMRWQASW